MKKCKKLGNRATQREIKEAHRARMEMRDAQRATDYSQFLRESAPYIMANLSVNHPNYGDRATEHKSRRDGRAD